jgi:hypothetical protein
MNTYKASELIVLHLSAGAGRRVYVLTHALDGFIRLLGLQTVAALLECEEC